MMFTRTPITKYQAQVEAYLYRLFGRLKSAIHP